MTQHTSDGGSARLDVSPSLDPVVTRALEEASRIELNAERLFERLMDHIDEGSPASVIRLSEGEAFVVGYPEYFNREQLGRQLRWWFGTDDYEDQVLADVRQDLVAAVMDETTSLCLPGRGRMRALSDDGRSTRDAILCAKLWSSLAGMGALDLRRSYANATFHKWLQRSRKITEVLKRDAHFVFVSRSAEAVHGIATAFELKSYTYLRIPPPVYHSSGVSRHFPDRYHELRAQFANTPPGSIALVGAGVLGKVYCHDIARAGSVAIDMGVVFEGWDGRPQHGRSHFSMDEMSIEHLQDHPTRPATVEPR